jgi:uncharacterized protein
MFENAEIALENLPAADVVGWQALDRRFALRLQIRALINVALAAAALSILQILRVRMGGDMSIGFAWLALIPFAAGSLLWPLISVPRKGYAVRDRDLLYKSGVIWRSVTAVPFNRVQHVETASTPLDRRFGLASLELFTAGSSGGDLKIHGLPADVAERLRVFVLGKAGAAIERD